MRRATACALLLALALAGCGSNDAKDEQAAAHAHAQAVRHARRMELGRRVFAEHCQSCHTLAGRRFTEPINEWEAPNFDEVAPKRSYVRARVDAGGPAMAGFQGELADAEYRAIIEYVTEAAGRNVVDDGDHPADMLADGRAIFAQHCAACHAIEGRKMTGEPVYVGMDFNLVKPSERYVIRKMKTGVLPEDPLMPSFRGTLTDAQMRAVAAYVTAVAKEGPEAPPG